MRIAVLGDIHANLPALEAALREARRAGCDAVFHTGDLVGYGGRPDECVGLVLAEGIRGARGDFDAHAAWGSGEPCCGTGDPRLDRLAGPAAAWTRTRLSLRSIEHLRDLPFALDLDLGGRRVLLAHSSPTELYLPVGESTGEPRLREISEDTPADVYLLGDTHRPMHRRAAGSHWINAGAVGLPADGDPRGCLAIVDLEATVRVNLLRFPYDIEAAVADLMAASSGAGSRDLSELMRSGVAA